MFSIKKKLITCTLAVAMAMGAQAVPVNATTITTDVKSSSGWYTYYVRKSGTGAELGTMKLWKDSGTVYNLFTASTKCNVVKSYVSQNNSGFKSNTAYNVGASASVLATKSVSNPTKIYGYCSVTYPD